MKLGLILEGGASRAYFSCGMLEALEKENIMADMLVGTSAGIADGVSYITKQSRRNYYIATRFLSDPRYMGLPHMLNRKNRSYYNLSFVFGDIPNKHLPFNYRAFAEYPGEVLAAVTNLRTGKVEYLPVPRDDTSFKVLQASCALPLLFPPIEIDGTPYMDGGIVNSIPLQPALEANYDKIIVILTQPRGYQKKRSKGMELMAKRYHRYPAFSEALKNRYLTYNQELANIAELEKEGRVFVMAPKESLAIERTERNPNVLGNLYQLGYDTFYEYWPALQAYLEAK